MKKIENNFDNYTYKKIYSNLATIEIDYYKPVWIKRVLLWVVTYPSQVNVGKRMIILRATATSRYHPHYPRSSLPPSTHANALSFRYSNVRSNSTVHRTLNREYLLIIKIGRSKSTDSSNRYISTRTFGKRKLNAG